MFTLTFSEPGGKRQSHPLADESRGLTVGRDPACDVVLTSKEVSRRHCRFFVAAGDLVVEDLGSHNGVLVAGQRAEGQFPLVGVTTVELGDVRCDIGATEAPAKKPKPAGAPSSVSAAARAKIGAKATETLPPGKIRAVPPRASPRHVQTEGSRRDPPAGLSPKATAGAPRAQADADARARTAGGSQSGSRKPEAGSPNAAPTAGRAAGVGAGAVLRGLGQYATVQIPLPAIAVVGRGDDSDVVLDDGSVSRRHAQLSRDARGLYRLEDLGSGNGTFVDGERITSPVLLADGSKLRFGDVELLFWRPPAAAGLTARHRMLIAVGLSLAAMFAALFFLKQRREVREQAQADSAPASSTDRASALSDQAAAALSSDRFDEAGRLAQQSIDLDPIATAPRKTLAQARREQTAQKLYGDATTKAQVGREEEALQMFARLDPQSRFFPRARIKAKELAQNLLRTHSTSCKLAATRAQLEAVIDLCGRALDLKCQMQDVENDSMRRSMRQAAVRLGQKDSWTCPSDLGPLFREEVAASEEGGEATLVGDRALRARYPDAAIFEAVSQYARGETANSLRSLTGGPAARGKTASVARDVAEKVRTVDGRFREGQTMVLRGELGRADEIWSDALKADAALMPPGATSFLGQQMRNTLSQAHSKAGDEKFAKAQYTSAYDEWTKGLAVQPKDAHLLDSLARLEKVAETLLATSPSCDQANTASRITRADPPSPTHLAAQKALESCGQ